MNISLNLSSSTPLTVDTSTSTQQTQSKNNPSLTVSVTNGTQNTQTTTSNTIVLSYPLLGPEDISINELLQDLKNFDFNQLKGMSLSASVMALNSVIGEVANAISQGGEKFIKDNAKTLTEFFGNVEKQAQKAETQLFDLINNSSYPDFNKFLSKMLHAAQDLRELASQAKHSLVMAQYNNVMDQAKQMEITAQKNYESTIKDIKAAEKEAIGKIISGSLSIAATVGGGVIGMKSPVTPGGGGIGGLAGAGMGQGIGGSLGQIVEGGMGVAAAKDRMEGAALKLEADLAEAIRKKMEATQKLLQEAEGLTDELRDIAKSLADMVLKLYQDFLSSQNQILQRANV